MRCLAFAVVSLSALALAAQDDKPKPDYEALKKEFEVKSKGKGNAKYFSSPDKVRPDFFGKLIAGASGTPSFKVLSIVDGKNALMTWGDPPQTFWVEMDTSKLVDGDRVPMKGLVHCTGRRQYTSTAGAKRTVLALKVID